MPNAVRAELLDQVCADVLYRYPSLLARLRSRRIVVNCAATGLIRARFANLAAEWGRA